MSTPEVPTVEPEDRIITRKELQKSLGVSSETVRRWLREGTLPQPDINMTRITRHWRLSSLQAAGIKIV